MRQTTDPLRRPLLVLSLLLLSLTGRAQDEKKEDLIVWQFE